MVFDKFYYKIVDLIKEVVDLISDFIDMGRNYILEKMIIEFVNFF